MKEFSNLSSINQNLKHDIVQEFERDPKEHSSN
jgi:hypothetical protein